MTYLSAGDEDGRNNVRGVSVITADAARHSRANEIFTDIKFHQGRHSGFQNRLHNASRNHCLTANRFTSALNPKGDITAHYNHSL